MAGCSKRASRPWARSGCSGARSYTRHRLGQVAIPRAPARPGRPRACEVEKCRAHLPARRVSIRLMRIDVNAFLGAYPYRRVPGTSPDALLHAMDRVGIDEAWVTHLPRLFWRDPGDGNAWLYQTAACRAAIPTGAGGASGIEGWEQCWAMRPTAGVPAVRCDPTYYGLDPAGAEMRALAAACAAARVCPVMPFDSRTDASGIPMTPPRNCRQRRCARCCGATEDVRLVVTHADRAFVEEVHFGSTPEEASRIWWDITWIWVPPRTISGLARHGRGRALRVRNRASRFGFPKRAWRSSTCWT